MTIYDKQTGTYNRPVRIEWELREVTMRTPEGEEVTRDMDDVDLLYDLPDEPVIIRPKWYWTIPLVGWFMIPYVLFSTPRGVIMWKSSRDEFIKSVAFFGPFVLIFLGLWMVTG